MLDFAVSNEQTDAQPLTLRRMLGAAAGGSLGFLELKDGLYFGAYNDQKTPHGEGVLQWASSEMYIGRFKEGKFHGPGLLMLTNGGCAFGNFVNGLFDGPCMLRLGNKDMILGNFENGKRHGVVIQYSCSKNLKLFRSYRKGTLEHLIRAENGTLTEDGSVILTKISSSFMLLRILISKEFLMAVRSLASHAQKLSGTRLILTLRFLGTKTRHFGARVTEDEVVEMGTFRRGKLQGFGVRLGSEGRIEGNFSWGLIEGLAFTFVVKENFGLLANYTNDSVKEVLQKTHMSTQNQVSRQPSSRSPQI